VKTDSGQIGCCLRLAYVVAIGQSTQNSLDISIGAVWAFQLVGVSSGIQLQPFGFRREATRLHFVFRLEAGKHPGLDLGTGYADGDTWVQPRSIPGLLQTQQTFGASTIFVAHDHEPLCWIRFKEGLEDLESLVP
jgi:hypothetical protein